MMSVSLLIFQFFFDRDCPKKCSTSKDSTVPLNFFVLHEGHVHDFQKNVYFVFLCGGAALFCFQGKSGRRFVKPQHRIEGMCIFRALTIWSLRFQILKV